MIRVFSISQAVLLAVLLHAFFLFVLSPVLKKGPALRKVDLVFWGSILRSQDLIPGAHEDQGISSVRVIAPVGLVHSAEASAWEFGSSVEKPVYRRAVASPSNELSPQKFITERVLLDEVPVEESALGLPKVKSVSLKELQP